MITFKPKRSLKHFLILFVLTSFIALVIIFQNIPLGEKLGVILSLYALIIALNALILYTTHYLVDENRFSYRSLFFSGVIEISNIKKMEVGKTLWVGLKPATAMAGIIIHYNSFDEIYISPENNKDFVHTLLEINPSIQVVNFKNKR